MRVSKGSLSLLFVVLLLGPAGVHAQQPGPSLEAARALINLDEKRLDEPAQALLYALLHRSHEMPATVSAWQLLGDLHAQRKRADQAFMAYFTALHFDLDEKTRTDITVAGKLLAEKSGALSPIKEKLTALIDDAAGEGDAPARELKALRALRDLEYPKLFPALIEAGRLYAFRVPFAEVVPALWLEISEMETALGHHWKALAAATIVVNDYADSDLAGKGELCLAGIYAYQLKRYALAATTYQGLIKSEGDTSLQAEARWGLAELRDQKEKAYSAAVEAYRDFIDHHAGDVRVPRAWMRIAELQISRLKQPEAGIASYGWLIQSCPESEQVAEARLAVAETYEKKMKDYAKAVAAYIEFAGAHQDHEKAAAVLYQAGRLAEEKMKDSARALEIYREVVNSFTKQKPVDAARSRIKKLEKTAAENE